ncbi:LysR family transcriptional regulator [Viridibacterium curvum]|uniref:LysR family transcriptional regulator n=1 Tax=Viridibacterium curvum TaxID=1101404 RepID=A0ABP9Q9H8_9RHOO
MDRLEAMQIFCKVVELGSFAAAADRLDISTSAVSRQVAQLEAHLQARLLNRTTRRLSLTDDGRAYYERCLQLLTDLEEAEELVGNSQASLRGTLRLTAPISFGIWQLPQALADFCAMHPDVKIDLSLSDHQVDMVEAGLDMAIRIGELGTQNLVARPIGKARLMTCASPAYLARRGTPKHPADLRHHACLTYAYNADPHNWRYQGPNEQTEVVHVSGPAHGNNGIALRELAAQGLGISRAPDFVMQSAVEEGRLVEILPEWNTGLLNIYAAYPSRRHLSAKVRGFVSFLQEWLQSHCPYGKKDGFPGE